MRLVIIANPVSGGGRAYRQVHSYVGQWKHPEWEAEILTTRGLGHAGMLAQELLKAPPDLVAVCGGDGTVNEIASRVPRPPFPVALVPAGTANVLARELGVPLNPIRALQTALTRNVRRVDLGEMNAGERRFLFVAGIGFDAYVAASVKPGLKKKLGMAAYAAAIVSCLRSYAFPDFEILVDGRRYAATSCLACNAGRYGGGLLFCPAADMSDGMLDVLMLEGRRRVALGCFLLRAWLGNIEARNWIHRVRARTLRVEGSAGILVQADGEIACRLPLEIGLIDKAFPLVSP